MGSKDKYKQEYEYESNRHKLDMTNPADRAKARIGFKRHLVSYISVNSFLWMIAIVTGSIWAHPWPLYPMFGWGIGLVSHYFWAYQKYEKWVEKEMTKEGQRPPRYLADTKDEELELKQFEQPEKMKPPRESDFI